MPVQLRMVFLGFLLVTTSAWAQEAQPVSTTASPGMDAAKPRLVMVEIEHWKTAFFNLPQEVPLFIEAGKSVPTHLREYDFTRGMQAMMLFLTLRPKAPEAPAYRKFLQKWPVYQEFFKDIAGQDYPAAAQALADIRDVDPNEPAVLFYTGSLNTQTGDLTAAEKNYRASLKIYPGYGPAYINLARLARKRGALDETKAILQEALQNLNPNEQKDSRQTVQAMLDDLAKTLP